MKANMELQRAALLAIHQQAAALAKQNGAQAPAPMAPAEPALADPTPPCEPPDFAPCAQPRRHQVVRWHLSPIRVTKLDFATRELAIEHIGTLNAASIYKYALMCGREIVECKLLKLDPIAAGMPELSAEEIDSWLRSTRCG